MVETMRRIVFYLCVFEIYSRFPGRADRLSIFRGDAVATHRQTDLPHAGGDGKNGEEKGLATTPVLSCCDFGNADLCAGLFPTIG